MEEYELHILADEGSVEFVRPVDAETKTLLLGKTSSGLTHHLYQKFGELHLVVYDGENLEDYKFGGTSLPCDEVVPEVLFPERCDYEFCSQLKRLGVKLNFAPYDHEAASKLVSGRLYGLKVSETYEISLGR